MRTLFLLALAAAGCIAVPVSAQAPSSSGGNALRTFSREPNTDRSGNDLKKVELADGDEVAQCEALCQSTPACVAFTFVKRSTTVPKPICWLKDVVPVAYESGCCTSGALQK